MSDSIPVVLQDLPPHVRGFVCLGSDYNPIIVINSRLPFEQQQMVYLHEYLHVKRNQQYDDNYNEYGGEV